MSWNENPWNQDGGRHRAPPEVEEWVRKVQTTFRRFFRGGRFGIGFAFLLAILFWGASGFYRVLPDEQGVVLRFGAFTHLTVPGLHYHLPWPVESVLTPKVTIINRIDVGLRAPFESGRAASGLRAISDVPEESLMLTGDENIVDVDFSVFWVIKDAGQFLFNIQNPVGTVKAVAESTMREAIGRNKIQPILTEERQQIEADVQRLMQATLDFYKAGIRITQVKMQKVDPPGAVIGAFRDVQAARADQERARNEAQAYRNKLVPEARGEAEKLRREAEAYREQTIAESEGEAQRFLAVYNEYRNASDVTRKRIFLETMERVLGGTNKVIIDAESAPGVVPYLPLNEIGGKGKGVQKGDQK